MPDYVTTFDIQQDGKWLPVGSKVTLSEEEGEIRVRDGQVRPSDRAAVKAAAASAASPNPVTTVPPSSTAK